MIIKCEPASHTSATSESAMCEPASCESASCEYVTWELNNLRVVSSESSNFVS